MKKVKTAEDYKKEHAKELSEISKDYYKRPKQPKLGRNEQHKGDDNESK